MNIFFYHKRHIEGKILIGGKLHYMQLDVYLYLLKFKPVLLEVSKLKLIQVQATDLIKVTNYKLQNNMIWSFDMTQLNVMNFLLLKISYWLCRS